MPSRRSQDRLRFLRVDHRSLFARRQFVRLIFIVAGIWVAYNLLLSDQSLVRYFLLRKENKGLRAEIARAEAAVDSLHALAEELEENPEAVERIARERFLLKEKDEKTYVFIPVDESKKGLYPPKNEGITSGEEEKGVDNEP